MRRPLLGRIGRPLLLIPGVALASYFLMALLPLQVQDEQKEQLPQELLSSYRKDLGIGEPLGFLRPWQKLAARERLGTSAEGVTGTEMMEKLRGSLIIGLLALLLSLVGAGLFAAIGTRVANVLFAVGLGTPTFLLALLLAPETAERGVVIPTLAGAAVLAVWPTVFLGRLLARSLKSELAKDYVRAARAKGLTQREVLFRHVLPNLVPVLLDALAPVATALLGGSFAVERVLGLPYFGQLYVMAVLKRQVAVVVVATTVFAALLALVTSAVELGRATVDPR